MSSVALPLSDIVDVVVMISPVAPSPPTFNIGCIIGPTAAIPASQRTRQYATASLAQQMLTDGFLNSSPEYTEALLYAGQTPQAQYLIVGRQDLTSIANWALSSGTDGTGYIVGDVLTVVQGGASGGTIGVTAVNGSGAITAATLLTQGTGYAVASALGTTGGHGTGATINISGIGDSALQAYEYCRASNSTWYMGTVTSAVTADHEAIAAYVQAATPPSVYVYATQDATALSGASGNVFAYMLTNKYNRVLGFYATTQGGVYPNNVYIAGAVMGCAMGLNTGLANSYFQLWGKTLVGIAPEPLTQSQVNTIISNNGNMYLNYGNAYQLVLDGSMGDGQFFDEILNIDMISAFFQYNCMDIFVDNPAVPMTDPGETLLIHAVNNACQTMVGIGWIATGTWEGVTILNLTPGTSLNGGYLAQAPAFSTQSAGNRAARQMMPIYVALIEAGAGQSLLIGAYVQR